MFLTLLDCRMFRSKCGTAFASFNMLSELSRIHVAECEIDACDSKAVGV